MNQLVPARLTAGCLILAPALEVTEQVLSPLTGRSTAADLTAIANNQTVFTVSVLLGILATVLFVPALGGLATACLDRTPRLARAAAAVSVLSMLGFFAVRMVQGVELQLVRDRVARGTAAPLVDHVASNAVGGSILIAFLGGSVVGLGLLATACWRAGLPKPAALALGVFPVLDLALEGHIGTIVSHLVLLGATSWLATDLLHGRDARLAAPATVHADRELSQPQDAGLLGGPASWPR
jgi:hypothetical protein